MVIYIIFSSGYILGDAEYISDGLIYLAEEMSRQYSYDIQRMVISEWELKEKKQNGLKNVLLCRFKVKTQKFISNCLQNLNLYYESYF